MPITWNSQLDTGIDVIDAQHRRIVGYVNQLEEARLAGDREKVGGVIEQLVDYTQSHFGFEEAMMEEAGYKFLRAHKKVHELFIKRVGEFTLRAAKGEDIAKELQGVLSTWLINHIASEDRDYAKPVLDSTRHTPQDVPVKGRDREGFMSSLLGRFFR
jgi:hemerythrin